MLNSGLHCLDRALLHSRPPESIIALASLEQKCYREDARAIMLSLVQYAVQHGFSQVITSHYILIMACILFET